MRSHELLPYIETLLQDANFRADPKKDPLEALNKAGVPIDGLNDDERSALAKVDWQKNQQELVASLVVPMQMWGAAGSVKDLGEKVRRFDASVPQGVTQAAVTAWLDHMNQALRASAIVSLYVLQSEDDTQQYTGFIIWKDAARAASFPTSPEFTYLQQQLTSVGATVALSPETYSARKERILMVAPPTSYCTVRTWTNSSSSAGFAQLLDGRLEAEGKDHQGDRRSSTYEYAQTFYSGVVLQSDQNLAQFIVISAYSSKDAESYLSRGSNVTAFDGTNNLALYGSDGRNSAQMPQAHGYTLVQMPSQQCKRGVFVSASADRSKLSIGGESVKPSNGQQFDVATATDSSRTKHFQFHIDSLYGDGKSVATSVASKCEGDFQGLADQFDVPGSADLSFDVIIGQGFNGAYHCGCDGTVIYCDGDLTQPNYARMLLAGEVVEVLAAKYSNSWSCDRANGEGLSRALAESLEPRAVPPELVISQFWLDEGMHDYITTNVQPDTNIEADACAVLFLNWLHYGHEPRFSWKEIVRAGGATLTDTYQTLTGRNDAWSRFRAVMNDLKDSPLIKDTNNPFYRQ